jgi:hypothetical protein
MDAFTIGTIIGKGLNNAQTYPQTFVETEDATGINLVAVSRIPVVCTVYCYKQMVGSHFVLDHPVNCNLNSSLFALDSGLGAKTLHGSSII